MAKIESLRTQFVEMMPETLEDGVIYVSQKNRLALHNCCCGCGEEVSTPLGRTEYRIWITDGKATLSPSIGNHDYRCGSHYFIEDGAVVWSGAMSRKAINAGRRYDRFLKRGRERGRLATVFNWLKAVVANLMR